MLVSSKMEELCPNVKCVYLACGYRKSRSGSTSNSHYDATESCNSDRFWQAIEQIASAFPSDEISLLFHYSGYGYAADGAPAWLVDTLIRRPTRFIPTRIITFFHELFATGWPWHRAFWNCYRQRSVAIRIAMLSDELATNRQQSACWLEQQTGRPAGSICHLPVCSNVGEPAEVFPWEKRLPRAALFGGPKFKEAFLKHQPHITIKACQNLGIDSLLDVGTPADFDRSVFQRVGITVKQTGRLPASDVSTIFGNSQFAFIDYYPRYVAKSGVLATAAAHGTVPLVLRDLKGEADGFLFGQHCLPIRSLLSGNTSATMPPCSAVSQLVRNWYASHSSKHHAAATIALTGTDATPAYSTV
jgi:hypothetical protein